MIWVLVYLLKPNFNLNKNRILAAIYRIQNLKTKTCFSKTSKGEICFSQNSLSQAKKCN